MVGGGARPQVQESIVWGPRASIIFTCVDESKPENLLAANCCSLFIIVDESKPVEVVDG